MDYLDYLIYTNNLNFFIIVEQYKYEIALLHFSDKPNEYLVNSSKNQRPLSNELPVQRQNLDLPLYESNVLQKSQRNLFKIRCTCFNTVGTVKETYQGNCRQSRRCELREEQNEQ